MDRGLELRKKIAPAGHPLVVAEKRAVDTQLTQTLPCQKQSPGNPLGFLPYRAGKRDYTSQQPLRNRLHAGAPKRPAYYNSRRAVGGGGTTFPRRQRRGGRGRAAALLPPLPVLARRGKQTARGLRAARPGRWGSRHGGAGGGQRAEPRWGWPAPAAHVPGRCRTVAACGASCGPGKGARRGRRRGAHGAGANDQCAAPAGGSRVFGAPGPR